jgi:ATP-dependent helicase/nuclease subunit A
MPATVKKLNLTPEQHAALSAHDRSVSLAAGAGCGKTFVLTERFLSYLDPQVLEPMAELHELVAITFTDAAAREMRARIRHRCYERLTSAADPDEQQAWRRLLRSLDAARISTIHSFCASLLRSHAVEAQLDPQFEQLDQAGADLLRLRTLDERLRQLLLERDERLINLATRFSLSGLREHLVDLLGENLAPVTEKWLDADPNQLISDWKKYFETTTRLAVIADFIASEHIATVRELCHSAVAASPELPTLLNRLEQIFTELTDSTDPATLLNELHELARVQSGSARKKNWSDESQFTAFKEACEKIRDSIKKSILGRPWNEEQLQEAAQVGLDLLALAADVSNAYQLAKQQLNVLEFDDLIQKAHQLLTDPRFVDVQRELASSTRLLLVDEFQDTDPVQVELVQAFCGNAWQQQGLFVVGDFKQSIYRFRGAKPKVSKEFRASLPDKSRLSLTTNFRSQGAILDFVNALFHGSFEGDFEPLHPTRSQQTPQPSIEFLWAPTDAIANDDSIPEHYRGSQRKRYLEARFIAKRLAELIDSQQPLIVEHGELRPLRPGDIAILLRSLSDVQVYEAALREQGFEYYLAGGHAFYAQQEIYDVLHLLRSVVSVADELSLAGALRSPLFALTDETLFWLVNHAGSLNAGLFGESLPEELASEDRAKVIRAGNVLTQLRTSKDKLLVAELLTKAIELTGYDAVLLAEFLGERKLANLHKLVEQARTLDRLNPGDVDGFVTQLSEFVTRAPKEPVATTSVSGDVVRIMTIHNAKGLEFPLVVVPDLERKSPGVDTKPVMDVELGPLVKSNSDDKVCTGWDLYQYVERREDQEEMLRLLYVACTRAADYLILSSSLADPHKPASEWLKFIGERFDLSDGTLLAPLPADYNTPQIRVITSEPQSDRKPAVRTRSADLKKLLEKTASLVKDAQGTFPTGATPTPLQTQSRRRFSFSRLHGVLVEENLPLESDPENVSPTAIDPLGFGTLVHDLLEQSPNNATLSEVEKLCKLLAPHHLPGAEEGTLQEATALVHRFLESPRAAQLAQSPCILREVEFILPWPDKSSGRYLHGFIDCLYQDPAGDWHLIDYKSNQVTVEGVSQAARQYEMQMLVYALAAERALGHRPIEQTVCFLRPGVEHAYSWNAADIKTMISRLDQAIATLLTGEQPAINTR